MVSTIGRLAHSVLLLLMLAVASTSVYAQSGCRGSISGSPMRPLAEPVNVSAKKPVSRATYPDLAQLFLNGVQAAGIPVIPEGRGTTLLDLTFRIIPPVGGNAGPTSVRGSTLSVAVKANDAKSRALVWVGTVDCTVLDEGLNAVARELGTIVGGALGKYIPKRPF
jgi:hypothetical protein